MARRTGLAGMSFSELRREMARRQRRIPVLLRKRARVQAKVDAIDAQIRELGGSVGAGGGGGMTSSGKRFKNEVSLADALAAALKGKTMMGVSEAAEAVQKAGYRTSSTDKNFRVMVNIALSKDKRFKRVERGQYTVK